MTLHKDLILKMLNSAFLLLGPSTHFFVFHFKDLIFPLKCFSLCTWLLGHPNAKPLHYPQFTNCF